MNQIDTLDEQILAALQANGRLTMKALAEQVGLSSPAMIERVRRLEERGVISGYRAVVSPPALGRPLTALIAAEVAQPNYDAFLQSVQANPAVVECHRTAGPATYVVKVNVPDTEGLERLVDDLSAAGALCTTSLVLSSPVPWRPVTPPEGLGGQGGRPTRRRRRARGAATTTGASEQPDTEGQAPAPRRRGRPRTRPAPEQEQG